MATELYALDMWNIFVVSVFGNFWAAVAGLALIMFMIMLMGRVSMYSVLMFLGMFFMCMAMGYGQGIVTVPLTLFILIRFIYDIIGLIGRSRV